MREGSKGKLVEMGGYKKPMIDHPKRVLESKGFKEELAKFGLTEELISTALVDDINNKPQNRNPELRLGAEILNMNKREEAQGTNNLIVIISGESAERYKVLGRDNTGIETSL
jgi:hypothetical protein